jgi:hypothetical protein
MLWKKLPNLRNYQKIGKKKTLHRCDHFRNDVLEALMHEIIGKSLSELKK